MRVKKLRYTFSKKRKTKMKIGSFVRVNLNTNPLTLRGYDVGSFLARTRILKIKEKGVYYTDLDFLCYPLTKNGPTPIGRAWIPATILEVIDEKEAAKIIRELEWFHMYTDLSVKTHPYTSIFK